MEQKFSKNAYLSFMLWGICSSMSVTVCTIVDASLIGNFIGSSGLAVSGIANPVFLTLLLLGVTVAVGANVQIGRKLGAADVKGANHIFNAQIFIGLVIGALLLICTLLFRGDIFRLLGVQKELLPLVTDYLTPIFFTSPIFIMYQIFSVSVRTDGEPRLAAIASGAVITVNLALDILFMGALKWGIIGASASMCIAEAIGTAVLFTHFFKKHSLLRFGFVRAKLTELFCFVKNGFGIGSAYIFQAIVVLTFNSLLLANGAAGITYVAIFGVLYTVSTIPSGIFEGAGNAFAPVISISAGEQDGKSMNYVLWLSLKVITAVVIVLSVLFLVFTVPILRLFGINPTELMTAIPVFRIFTLSIIFSGVNTLITAFWQTIGRARLAGIMSVVRNLVLMLSLGFILIQNYQIMGLALTYLFTETASMIILLAVYFIRPSKRYIEEKYTPKGRVFEQYYTIEAESMEQISADLERVCDEWEINPKQSFILNFIVEELLLNIIKFGLKEKDSGRYVDIKLLEGEDSYTLRIRDNVKTYNPFESDGDDIDNAVLKMIKQKTKYCEYERKLIFNYLYLIV